MNTELVSDIGYKVQAVLVEEDEEEEDQKEEEEEKTVDQEVEKTVDRVEEEEEKTADQVEEKEEDEKTVDAVEEIEEEEKTVSRIEEKEEEEKTVDLVEKKEEEEKTVDQADEEVEEEEKEEKTVNRAEEEEKTEEEVNEEEDKEKTVEQVQEEVEEEEVPEDPESKQEVECVPVEESVQVLQHGEENDQREDVSEPVESVNTDLDPVCQIIKDPTIRTNGMMNGKEENGTERSLSPSDAELSSPEVAMCYAVNDDSEEEISENGQEVAAEQQMCVRALYDYQAEDESEISFEPGDIIRDVETVDKAWWRGWSKDGRQGLFPANYVETI